MEKLNKLSFEIPRIKNGNIHSMRITDEMFNEICSLTPWIEDTSRNSLKERLYCINNNLQEIPKCISCQTNIKWQRSIGRYSEFHCSSKCSANSKTVRLKCRETTFEKTGYYTPFENPNILKAIQEKYFKETGFYNPSQNPEVQDLKKNNYFNKTGFQHWSQNPEVQDLKKNNYFNKTGFQHWANNPEVREKMKQTNLEKYGVENISQTDEAKEKVKQTCQERYGVEYYLQTEEAKERAKQTFQERYGVEYISQSEEIREKIRITSQERYGVDNPSQSQEVKDKISISKVKHFQARRNDEGTDYAGVVYILHFPQHSAVKIGLTADFNNRSKGLISDFGEYNIINIIETESVFALESSLHEKFSEYRMCLEEGCGRTEFFSDEILEDFK
jgi:hypothetical protein